MSENTHSHHVIPLKIYLGVASALFILTGVTVWVASFDFGELNIVVALLIACLKGSLVALYFMHLRYDNKLYGAILVLSLLFLAIFIGFTMIDTMFRGEIEAIEGPAIKNEAIIYDENK